VGRSPSRFLTALGNKTSPVVAAEVNN